MSKNPLVEKLLNIDELSSAEKRGKGQREAFQRWRYDRILFTLDWTLGNKLLKLIESKFTSGLAMHHGKAGKLKHYPQGTNSVIPLTTTCELKDQHLQSKSTKNKSRRAQDGEKGSLRRKLNTCSSTCTVWVSPEHPSSPV
ncbi:unnamed protein product [Pleuronectes platessa]|uniref:Uncharacterized protein n=1 Tax=Pleuronectes platessa TaxID=8262 RepID=A0A9N7TZ86_PLEPL|nr:unnamed protein product [Pleuronectes platessa]